MSSEASFQERSGYQRLRRRRRILLVIVLIAAIAAGSGVLAATFIKSPAEVAAQTAPPKATVLTAPVRRQVITDTVLGQGVVGKPKEITGPAGAASGGSSGNAQAIVTRIFIRQGGTVQPGSVLLQVGGDPVFVFKGSFPAYRDLVPGESGPDVAELQAGLESLGFSIGSDTAGVFGKGTEAAVADYYQSIGFAVPKLGAGPKADQGAMVPLSDIMFVPRFPARVVKYGASVGGTASSSLVTLSMGSPVLHGQLSPADAGLVRPGVPVTITDQSSGLTRSGTIRSVSRTTSTTGSISGGVYVPLRITTRGSLPASTIGQDVTLTISAARSAGPVLAVPEAAVFAAADGRTYVTRVTAGGAQVRVPVRTEFSGNGLVGVVPIDGGTLAPGDNVLTGENYLRTSTGGVKSVHGAPGGTKQFVGPPP